MINRAAFAHALRAVLEHVGTRESGLGWVGWSESQLYATDGYTALLWRPSLDRDLPPMSWRMATREAKDLLRYVKPNRVREKLDDVELLVARNLETGNWELHVGLVVPLDETIPVEAQEENAGQVYDSEVYELLTDDVGTHITAQRIFANLDALVSKTRVMSNEWVLQSGLVARFAAAEVEYGDRTRWYLCATPKGDAAVVTVGDSFLGGVMGLSEPVGESEYELRDASLRDWGLGGEQ